MDRVLIVGCGIAGIAAARELAQLGWQPLVVDKGRHHGGRMATRRFANRWFDHGAQFFTARDARFRQLAEDLTHQGIARVWFQENGHPRYCGLDGMNAVARHLAASLNVRLNVTISRAEPAGGGWSAVSDSGEIFTAAALILTAPLPQAVRLLPEVELPGSVRAAEYDPCFALMAAVAGHPGLDYASLEHGDAAWIADNGSKASGLERGSLTLHSTARFARDHFDHPPEQVARLLWRSTGRDWPPAEWQLHRWRYARAKAPLAQPCYFSSDPAPFALAGDAFADSRVEAAWLSGIAAAQIVATAVRRA
ncbi:MAG: FAD-dependent oxidoreductase [Bryobacteraceae bacterium]|nr:FAD-dependent oxidoreductase [Bryobacteraceae bacterium]